MKYLSVLFSLFLIVPAFAQEEEVPSFETVVEDVIFNTSTRIVIDEKAIKESRAPNVTTLLASQANITITNTPFQANSIYIRGGDSSHVLILVDGVPFYDASTIQRTINLNSLDIKSIRRIEILKGSQTVLYGGQALSGVIKIDTLPQDTETKTGILSHLGTSQTRDLSATHIEKIDEDHAGVLRAQGSWKDLSSPVLDSEKKYSRNSWNGEGAYIFKGVLEGNIKGMYIQELNYSPTSDFMTYKIVDADDFKQFSRQLGVSSTFKFNDVPFASRLTLGMQNSQRQYDQPISATNAFLTDYNYGANLRSIRLDLTPFKTDFLTVNVGASYIYEDFVYRNKGAEISNSFSEQRGIFAKTDLEIMKQLKFFIGGRLENWAHQEYVGTYQAGITAFEKTKLEVATGYKIPSLFQLYSAAPYGNPDLKEEKSIQYTLSQELLITEKQQFSITLFDSHFSDLIGMQGSLNSTKYVNIAKTETRGVEFLYSLRPTDSSSLSLAYGYQEPRDMDNNRWLTRRPLVNGSIKYLQSWGSQSGSVEFVGVGERVDRSGASEYTSLPGYVTANASYSFDISKGLTAYTRLNNLFNHRYQDSYTYYSEGFTGVIGGEYWF